MNKFLHHYIFPDLVGPLLAACLFCFLVASCQTDKKQPDRKQPAKPFKVTVAPKPVLGTSSFQGNTYTITGYACGITNGLPADLVWPKRVHIDLSVDGGSNYTRRIGYGVPSDGTWVNYEYSLPWWDRTLLTENAKLRMTNLEGTTLGTSFIFTIAGIGVTSPAQGDVITPGTFIDLTWYQYGAGSEVEMGYITPSNETWAPFMTWSNCVAGVNTVSWQVTLPSGLSQAKLVLRSVLHPANIGYSGVISTP